MTQPMTMSIGVITRMIRFPVRLGVSVESRARFRSGRRPDNRGRCRSTSSEYGREHLESWPLLPRYLGVPLHPIVIDVSGPG
jgi:hypothetical protein